MSPPNRSQFTLAVVRGRLDEFDALLAAGCYDDACALFLRRLDMPTLYDLEASLYRTELLEKLEIDLLSSNKDRAYIAYSLALSLNLTGGWPNRAISHYERSIEISRSIDDDEALSQTLGHYAKALRQCGRFVESETAAIEGLRIIRERGDRLREAVNLYWLGMGLAHRGEDEMSERALQRSLRMFDAHSSSQSAGVVNAFLSQRALWLGELDAAVEYASRGIALAEDLIADESHVDLHGAEKVAISCIRMKGDALAQVSEGDDQRLADAERLLLIALERAKRIEFVEEELPALRAMALLDHKRGNSAAAREHLDRSWHLASRGGFVLYDADSYNILARIELDAGNKIEAVEAARHAFELSLCDGGDYTYNRGLNDALSILREMGEQAPNLSSAKPEVVPITLSEIDPPDEFGMVYQNES